MTPHLETSLMRGGLGCGFIHDDEAACHIGWNANTVGEALSSKLEESVMNESDGQRQGDAGSATHPRSELTLSLLLLRCGFQPVHRFIEITMLDPRSFLCKRSTHFLNHHG